MATEKKGVTGGGKKKASSGINKKTQSKKAPVKNNSHPVGNQQKKNKGMGKNQYSRSQTGNNQYRRAEKDSFNDGFNNYSQGYSGRGQMNYDDFVRNRELFGGEENEYNIPQNRRTGGAVNKKPKQGTNKDMGEKNRSKSGQSPERNSQLNSRKIGNKNPNADRNNKQKRSKEIMNERARRKKIRRHAGRASKTMTPQKRKIKRFLTGFIIFSVIALISVVLSLTVFFKTEKIVVTGETRYSREEIIKLSGIETGENIFLCDKTAASKNIVDALPYVEKANVDFVIPNAITIEIIEEVPSYAVGYADGYYIMGENGRILEKTAENYDNLPIVQGSEITSNTVGVYADFTNANVTSIMAELVKVLDAYQFENITVIDVSNTADIKFVYDDRITVVIGIPEDISYKVKTAQTIINEKLDPNNTGLIKGRLDVSMCNETKKSYFNENEVYEPPQKEQPTTSPQPTQEEETQASEETATEPTEETTEEAVEETPSEETASEEILASE